MGGVECGHEYSTAAKQRRHPGLLRYSFGGGGTPLNGVSGWAVGDIAYFTSGGIWVKRSTVPARVRRQWDQPVPINAFKTFDQGSQMEVFCNLIGAAMLSEHNLPLAGFSFADALTKPLLPSVFYNRSDATLAGMSGQTGVEEFGDGSVLTYSEIVANINITTSTEKLSTAALLAGLPTGGNCTGTYDRSSPPATHVWVGDRCLDIGSRFGWVVNSWWLMTAVEQFFP